MAGTKKKRSPEGVEVRKVPFDEALKRVWNAPPQHKTSKKAVAKKKRG